MVMHGGKGQLTCCNQAMQHLAENTVDAAQEKHVPVAEKSAEGYVVKVGSVAHPMEEKHYIEWVELHAGEEVHVSFLKPGDVPQANFAVPADQATPRAYCNLHGLWKG
jgi:superoxide reductase